MQQIASLFAATQKRQKIHTHALQVLPGSKYELLRKMAICSYERGITEK